MTARVGLLLALLALAGCGGSSNGLPTIQAAHVYSLAGFVPAGAVQAGRPTTVSFVIRQPSGKPLTQFKRGPGPHTGVHLIYVRQDLAYFVHHHPPIAADGTIADQVTLPGPGPYRLVVDVYPVDGPNFQLFGRVRAAGVYRPRPLPPPEQNGTDGGYVFTLSGAAHLRAIQAEDVTVTVTAPDGRPAQFEPWLGALAHAIFFRGGTLDYFHTHVCSPGATGCTSVLGGVKVTGSSSKPGKLNVGILLPAAGTWRLFLQCQVGGRVLTAPFTLHVT